MYRHNFIMWLSHFYNIHFDAFIIYLYCKYTVCNILCRIWKRGNLYPNLNITVYTLRRNNNFKTYRYNYLFSEKKKCSKCLIVSHSSSTLSTKYKTVDTGQLLFHSNHNAVHAREKEEVMFELIMNFFIWRECKPFLQFLVFVYFLQVIKK